MKNYYGNDANNYVLAKCYGDDELMHYGVIGQKWGVRRYQNEDGTLTEAGKKKYAKTLNKLDKEAANAIGAYMRNTRKASELSKKSLKTKNAVKSKKLMEKSEKATEEANINKKYLDKIESNTWKAVAQIVQNNYDVTVKDCIRSDSRSLGENIAAAYLAGPLGTASVMSARDIAYGKEYATTMKNIFGQTVAVNQNPGLIKGKKYSVKRGSGRIEWNASR